MKIELYNDKWLNVNNVANRVLTVSPHIDLPSNKIDNLAFRPHPVHLFPSTTDLHRSTDTFPIAPDTEMSDQPISSYDPLSKRRDEMGRRGEGEREGLRHSW